MEGLGQPGDAGGGNGSSTGGGAAAAASASFPPPPVFGFSRDDSINLEDIFVDWFNEDNLNGPPSSYQTSSQDSAAPAILPQEAYAPALTTAQKLQQLQQLQQQQRLQQQQLLASHQASDQQQQQQQPGIGKAGRASALTMMMPAGGDKNEAATAAT
eukprot:evm.model.NODE_10431_length_8836_cov_15.761657.1